MGMNPFFQQLLYALSPLTCSIFKHVPLFIKALKLIKQKYALRCAMSVAT